MKKVFAILLAGLMLAASAAAEELYTFAGLKWDTPISECEAALEEGTGAGFTTVETDYSRYVIIDPGYYSVLGLPIEATGSTLTDGIMAYYEKTEAALNGEVQPDDDAAWALSSITCTGDWMPLDAEGFKLIEAVIENAARKYGEPTLVALADSDTETVYTVPQEEFPYILRDSFAFAEAQDWEDLPMIVAFRNVCVLLTADLGDNVIYHLQLAYMKTPFTEVFLGAQEDVTLMTFPWVDGKPVYVEIVP